MFFWRPPLIQIAPVPLAAPVLLIQLQRLSVVPFVIGTFILTSWVCRIPPQLIHPWAPSFLFSLSLVYTDRTLSNALYHGAIN